MARIFKTPFGAQGDTEQVPEAPQGDGSVSLTQGFGYDYEREYEDPAAKDIRREVMNGLFHDVTEAIGDIQLSGIAKWSADAAPYPAGAVVWRDSVAWMSTAGNNSSVPGSGSWKAVDLSSSILLSEPIDQVPDAETVQEALDGLGALGTNFATATEAQALSSLTKILTPGRFADSFGAIEQQIGVGQTWQYVSDSRSMDVTYTNTTGRPIMVAITQNMTDLITVIRVDGINIASISDAQGTPRAAFSFIVPNLSTYQVEAASGTPNIASWTELR